MNINKYQEAKKLKQEGKLEEAITAYQQAIEINPNFYSYHHE
ncbi:MAG: tetratricopeptide repeat protein, partial [Okeania sp. SIO3C4]|nr:tetratricopeptide repeat protein [Okeania sp. SIO3C4]